MKRLALALGSLTMLVLGCVFIAHGADKQIVNYWSRKTGPDQLVVQEAVAAFNRQNPQIEVKFQVMPWGAAYYSRIRTAILTGQPPEIFDIAPWLGPYFLPYVQPFTEAEFAGLGIKKTDYAAEAMEGVRYGDRYVGVPLSILTLALYYNKDLFQKAGLDPDRPPRDFKEFLTCAKKLTRDTDGDGKVDQWGWMLGNSLNPNAWLWESILVSNGGALLNKDLTRVAFEGKPGLDALQFLTDLAYGQKVAPPELADPSKSFVAGKLGMTVGGIWMIPAYQGKIRFGTAPLPQLGSNRPASWGSLDVYVLPKHTPAALAFTKWMAGPEGQKYYAKMHLPARLEVLRSSAITADPHFSALAKGIGQIFIPPAHKDLMEVYDRAWKAIQSAYGKSLSPQQALDQAARESNEILGRK
jgi:multiple sugar transport system substrate-binding protein